MKKGFTFIEILVVTTIIAVLTAVGAANFRVANQKSRDGRRQGDLQQIRAALEIYRSDVGDYPSGDIIAADTITLDGVVYMSDVPNDPSTGVNYYYSSDGQTYSLCAAMELLDTGSCSVGGASCGSGSCNYQVNSPE